MTASKAKTLQALVQDFFVQHLAIERNVSPHTISAYRDAMKLFLRHCSEVEGCSPDELSHEVLDTKTVRAFLNWLERVRNCSARTRNQRLAALKSFARYVANVAPEHLERCRLIRELPPARFERPQVHYLTDDEVVQLIAGIDGTTAIGRRDRALLLLLYNTGARVQELVGLDIADIDGEAIPFVRITGKGRKQRTTPLWSRTMKAIEQMLTDRTTRAVGEPLFLNARGGRLGRSGVTYILRRAQDAAQIEPRHAPRLSPHVIRHTTAMHLLQSGVDITTIASWLGHSRLSTTHAYVEINLRMKQAAIAADAAMTDLDDVAYPSPDIVDWLEKLAARTRYVQPTNAVPRRNKQERDAGPRLRITERGG